MQVKFANCSHPPEAEDGAAGAGDPCYSTTVIGEQAISWLRRLNASVADGTAERKPFFACVLVAWLLGQTCNVVYLGWDWHEFRGFCRYVAFKAPHIQDGAGWPVPLVESKYVHAPSVHCMLVLGWRKPVSSIIYFSDSSIQLVGTRTHFLASLLLALRTTTTLPLTTTG